MNTENHSIPQHYIKLMEFLGRTLDPDYKIMLHSPEDEKRSTIVISNNHVDGRELGVPLSGEVLQIITNKGYHSYSYRIHYTGISAPRKKLRSSILLIENTPDELIGLLTIDFDDSKYTGPVKQLLGLCYSGTFVKTNLRYDETYEEVSAGQGKSQSGEPGTENPSIQPLSGETVPVSGGETVNEALSRILREMDLNGKGLSQSRRLAVMERLERGGIFLPREVVKDAALALGVSQASIYRYLSKIRRE